ncbi:MAG: AAA family ATPase, partial [Anaerolineales bacterium]|nr:AAA family ATPase [Anaerolineales bacterium]
MSKNLLTTPVITLGMDSRMERPGAYIPRDRQEALYHGSDMPDRVRGAALFADISGFTPLTESLLNDLGPQRGAEELSRHLNLVYDALINILHQYGGSVISFSGDAITCWLDDDNGLRATACAFAMQSAMSAFAHITTPTGKTISLAMKTAVAGGTARRFLIGNPDIQRIDVLAGSLLDELVGGEHCAQKGDVVVSETTLAALAGLTTVERWCGGENNGRFAILSPFTQTIPPKPWRDLPPDGIDAKTLRPWLLPAVFDRLNSGGGEFLAELRPAVALFMRFAGIDYDQDPTAADKLNQFIQAVQKILARYESNLLQLTIGDKGSSLYAAFGAPLAHEDDAIRAISAALELQALSTTLDFITGLEIGISQGRMRTGAYGGVMRRTYGVLGDDVNLAARLMQLAQPGEILVSSRVWAAAEPAFIWERRPDTPIKGKAEPIPVFKVTGVFEPQTVRLQEPNYTLPMVGREAELAAIDAALEPVFQGSGQIIHISGEAGIGKSRLVSEIVQRVSQKKVSGFGGECQSYGTKTSYLVWQRIWHGIFNLSPEWSQAEQIKHLEKELVQVDPTFAARMPVLSSVLKLQIPDNDLTRSFDAKLRKSSLESMLLDCLRAKTKNSPALLVLEDCHWIDPLSLELLDVLGRGIADRPVLLVIVTRALKAEQTQGMPVSQLPYYTRIHLSEFTPAEAKQLIALKLAHFFGTQQDIPKAFIDSIV